MDKRGPLFFAFDLSSVAVHMYKPSIKKEVVYPSVVVHPSTNEGRSCSLHPEMSRPGSGTVHASSNVAASHLLGNYLT